MKMYKKLYINRRPGLKPISIWVNADPKRFFDEVIIGQNISIENIKHRRFDYPVSVCYCAKSFKRALRRFDIEKYVKNNETFKKRLSNFVDFFKEIRYE